MADAAAFFASKKKKKAFKFNANNIDASTIEKKIHVYVPSARIVVVVPRWQLIFSSYPVILLELIK